MRKRVELGVWPGDNWDNMLGNVMRCTYRYAWSEWKGHRSFPPVTVGDTHMYVCTCVLIEC